MYVCMYVCRRGEGWYGGKRMIKRLNEESGRQENAVLSTWRRDKHSTLVYVHVFRDFQYRVIFHVKIWFSFAANLSL